MNKMGCIKLNAMITAFLTICLFFSSIPVSAESDDASISILLTDTQRNITVSGVEVSMYKIAEFTDYKKHEFTVTEEFEQIVSRLDFSTTEKGCSMENAEIILNFIKDNDISAQAVVKSDENGITEFGKVEKGIYLIDSEDSDKYLISAFLVEAPLYEDGKYYNEVQASPKILSITDDNSLPDSSVSDTPPDYGEKIPQTGQLKWPVPVLAILGITLIVIGYADRCFRSRKHDED